MIKGIDNPSNKQKIALVAVGYNRLHGLSRLLQSLEVSDYGGDEVPLVISIDCSGDEELYAYVRNYQWPYGDKYVNIQTERLGLKNHIYQCGDLTKYFKAIALFEDDLWASPFYFNFIRAAVEKYGQDERICQIALYRNEWLGGPGFFFDPLHDGTDCFLWQDICTWGECWTEQMWTGFREWLSRHDDSYVNQVDMPAYIKTWTRAWSKYFIAYEVDTGKHVVFPHESLTTNFNDAAGEHGTGGNSVQVNVLHGIRLYHFGEVETMAKYDIYSNYEKIIEWLPKEYQEQTCLDLYGLRDSYQGKRYVLSMKLLPFKTVEEWGLEMRPVEMNLFYGIKGVGIRLYDTNIPVRCKNSRFNAYTTPTVGYYLRIFNPFYMFFFSYKRIRSMVLKRIKLSK